ncbi:MAG: ATP-binding cassette domain-containing protein [Geminicoccaceae bacterium]
MTDDITLDVKEGEIITMVGSDFAGKPTYRSVLAGLRGATADMITFDGRPIGGAKPADIVSAGIAIVLEGPRFIPILKERRGQSSISLSGGQQ